MSWIIDNSLTVFQKFCINVLKCGPVPKHIAFIMDGNRRYAKKTKVEKTEGHSKGFEKLAECLQWCKELGVKEVTVYAFSIENFKRSEDEVNALMQLAKEKFQKLLEEKDKLMTNGVCIRVIGNLSLLPPDFRKLIAEAVLSTKDNKKAILNVAFSYTSRDEIATSMKEIVGGVDNHEINVEDIDENLISQCLYTNQSPDPEVLVRTSGEVRLSDFLLWQTSNTEICFAKVLWPEFCVWHLLACVFKYQRCYSDLQKYDLQKEVCCERNSRVTSFLENLQQRRFEQLETYAKSC
ncbi:dehydrodolichyl diphosphate synthase complex subunit DHDDS [Anoplophora glabripennis]|uniref:dehydrodolichyl diphosphate synthase complex subunit DHDDS n=1 Tax=Anoplophora glabripennis TaxID=217634 RepID=UPI000874829C|nr:dehydrodolichyl diphosphate synthase complex subunit DHDDS [Anoplophora glabripennis]